MKHLVLVAIAFLSVHCFPDEEETMLPNQHASTILTGQDALDPLLPKTPRQGHFQTIELQPPTTMNPAFAEAIQQELIGLQSNWGLPPAPDNRQLAKLLEYGSAPPALTLPLIPGVAAAEIQKQDVWYQRTGRMITMGVDIAWLNTNVPISGNQVYVELPFQADVSIASTLGAGSSIAHSQSSFRTGDVALNTYEFAPPNTFGATTFQTAIRRIPQIAASVIVIIGDTGLDGGQSRFVVGTTTYPTDGIRNPEWPFIIWISFPDVHPSLPAAEIFFEYDSAKIGDVIDLLDSGLSVVQSLPALGAPDVPDGKNSFTVITADTYHVRLRGVISEGYVVD